MLVARAHRHAGDVNIAVSHGDQSQVFFPGAFAADGELGPRRARRGLRHLAASIGIDFGIEHEDVDVAPARQDVVEAAEAYVIRPAVAADDPDALLDQYVGERQELSGLVRINRAQFFFERRHALALDVDVSLLFLFGGHDRARPVFTAP